MKVTTNNVKKREENYVLQSSDCGRGFGEEKDKPDSLYIYHKNTKYLFRMEWGL